MTDRARFLSRLGIITVIAAIGRIWYAVAVADPRVRGIKLSDQVFYHEQARLVAEGRGFLNPFYFYASEGSPFHQVVETALHPPLYSVFLAAPARLGIDSMLSQRVLTCLLGASTVFLLGLLGRRIAGVRAGLLSAGLGAVLPALWVNDSVIGLETLYSFFVVCALLAIYAFWRRPRVTTAVAIGGALALASLTRSEGPLLFVLLVVPTVLLVPGLTWAQRAKHLGVMALVAVLVVGPWVVRNLTTFEEPTVLGTGYGLVLAFGNCDQTYSGPLLGYWSNDCAFNDYSPKDEESHIDKLARDRATSYIGDHLDRVPVVVAARVGRVWSVFRPIQNVELDDFYERRGKAESWAVLVGYLVMLPLSIAGLRVLRRRRVPIFPYIAIAVSVSITVALSFGITRYRAPVDVVMPVLAAVAIDAFMRSRRGSRVWLATSGTDFDQVSDRAPHHADDAAAAAAVTAVDLRRDH